MSSRRGPVKPPKRAGKRRAHKQSKWLRESDLDELSRLAIKRGSFKLPELISTDKSLSPKTPQVALALFCCLNKYGYCCRTQAELAKGAGVCVKTVRKAIRELEKAGYITSEDTKPYYHNKLKRVVRGRRIYRCYVPATGFVFVPRRVMGFIQRRRVQGAGVKVYLYICYRQNNGRAWPSLSMIARDTGLSRKAVCAAKKDLTELGLIHFQHCRKENQAYSCNSYFHLWEAVCIAIRPEEAMPGTTVLLECSFSGWPSGPRITCIRLFLPLSMAKHIRQRTRCPLKGGGVIFALLC